MSNGSKQTSASLAAEVIALLDDEQPVNLNLPDGGRLQLDHRLPFLCVYRRRPNYEDPGTEQLVTSELAHLVIPAEPRAAAKALKLLRAVCAHLAQHFGTFLLVELWSIPSVNESSAEHAQSRSDVAADAKPLAPRFEIVASMARIPRNTVEAFSKSLSSHAVAFGNPRVLIGHQDELAPPGLKPLARRSELEAWNCFPLGLAVSPSFRDETTGEIYPAVLRSMQRTLSSALRQAFFAFMRQRTATHVASYCALGDGSVVEAVLDIDRQLADVDRSFDLLLQATPVNAENAWREFRRSRFETPPVFYYRPLALDPTLLKRQLYLIPVERVEDPTLSYLFRQKQEELDRQITLLADVGTPRFLPESLQIYGGVSDSLLKQAQVILERVPTRSGGSPHQGQLDATEFASRAQLELGYYQQQCPDFTASVSVREDMYSGMMVSRNQLLIGGKTRVPSRRVDALLQHEIGTHLVTRYNGHLQPFQQLEVGLAGYDGLQEGLAVLAEYLVGGLSRFRTRVLAARVVAAHRLLAGASFIDTFRLNREHGFSQRTAYTVTMRIYRGGGLTKDAVYLRGLLQILKYLQSAGELEPLYLGKIASSHLPLIAELRSRGVINPPALRPRYLEGPEALKKIERLRSGMNVLDLMQ